MEESEENIETISVDDSSEDCNSLVYSDNDENNETNFQYDLPQYSLDNETLVVIDDDSLSSSDSEIINVRKPSNDDPTSNTILDEQIIVSDDSDIETYDQIVPIKNNIVPATTRNSNLFTSQKENNSLNSKKIFIPNNNTSTIRLNPMVKSNQIKIASTTSVNKPKTAFIQLQPESSLNTKYPFRDKSVLKPKPQLKITSSNESESEVYIVPHNGMNYMISKKQNPILKPDSSFTPTFISSSTVVPVEPKTQLVIMPPKGRSSDKNQKGSKFVARMQQLPTRKFKLVPKGQVPTNFKSVVKQNPNIVKQTIDTNPTQDVPKVGAYFRVGNSWQTPRTKKTKNFPQKRLDVLSGKSPWNKMSRTDDVTNTNRINKYIPHTVTSKDSLEKHLNTFFQNNHIESNINNDENHIPSLSTLLQLRLNLEYNNQSDSLPSNNTIYGKTTKNGDDKSKTKFLKKHRYSNVSDDEIIEVINSDVSEDLNISEAVENHSNMNKILMSDEIIDLDEQSDSDEVKSDTSDQFISCKACDALVLEPELIDNLYCSLICKNLDTKQIVSEEEHVINETAKLPEKPIIDRKQILKKLENRINKRKQMIKTSCPEYIMINDDDWDDQLKNNEIKLTIEENQPSVKAPLPIITPEIINDYDDEDDDNSAKNCLDLQYLGKDKALLNYMMLMNLRSAPRNLFDNPYPTEKNLFILGQKLEGIDPEHQALFCVMTVSEVRGYRIKLHFDGYPDIYDYWVNADCPNLFHTGWCEMNSRIIQPPYNYENEFDWIGYLSECQALPAPKCNFASTLKLNNCTNQHQFHIGDKLEVLDRLTRTLTKQLICVATVADILGDRIRIHFDGWTDDFDYWTDITSTNLHPVGWCDYNGRSLSQPSGYNDMKGKKPFNWADYLVETNSRPVPKEAFVYGPIRDFLKNMTIEVVDLVVPRLIRIAKIIDVRGDELKIVYDGFDSNYEYWVEDDSPDIHPVGWSSKTKHPIELPPESNTLWTCYVHGCKGHGNSKSLKTDHTSIEECPYELDKWKAALCGMKKPLDRLKTHNVIIKTKLPRPQDSKNEENSKINTEHQNLVKIKDKINEKRLNFLLGSNNIGPECDSNAVFDDTNPCVNDDKLRKQLGLSLLGYNLSSISMETQRRYWTRHNDQLGIPLLNTTDARKWSIQEVAAYVNKVVTCFNTKSVTDKTIGIPDRFIDQAIDGEAFLMLTQDDMINILKIPLGQALKLSNAIVMLRHRVSVFDLAETNLPQH